MSSVVNTLGLVVAIGIPLVVLLATLFWHPDRSVRAVEERIDDEDTLTSSDELPPQGLEP